MLDILKKTAETIPTYWSVGQKCSTLANSVEQNVEIVLKFKNPFQLSEWILPGYDMMVEGGQAEGGDGVQQTKEMRTEINGGSAQDPANFEVSQ